MIERATEQYERTKRVCRARKAAPWAALFALASSACASPRPSPPKWPISPPSALCHDPTLAEGDFCVPPEAERWLSSSALRVTAAHETAGGSTAPLKLRVEVPLHGSAPVAFSAKFKRVPDALDEFNNSPRRELAAYELQKLFLDPHEYVVPATTMACLKVPDASHPLSKLKKVPGTDCVLGVLSYWVENVSAEDVRDRDLYRQNAAYRASLGNAEILTTLIGHQDSLGDNVVRSTDPLRPRVLAVDNGLSLGALGKNPIRLISEGWNGTDVPLLPGRAVHRLRAIRRADLDALLVVAEMRRDGGTLVPSRDAVPVDPSEGVRRTADAMQFGLTKREIDGIESRLGEILELVP